MIYQPGQVKPLLNYVTEETGLFLLGGPADANEAQVFHARFPHVPIIGVEPGRTMYSYQMNEADFPGVLIPKALWNCKTIMPFFLLGEDNRSSRLSASYSPAYFVETTTIDEVVHSAHLPGKVVLWLDIERSELKALEGACECFDRGLIQAVYLEVLPDTEEGITEFLSAYGFREAERVNVHGTTKDVKKLIDYRFDGIYVHE